MFNTPGRRQSVVRIVFAGLALASAGCGGSGTGGDPAPASSSPKPASSSPKPAPEAPAVPVAKAAPKAEAKPVAETKPVAEPARVEPTPKPTPAADALAAKPPAAAKDEPKPAPKEEPKLPRMVEPARVVEPTTTRAAVAVVDLRNLPKLNSDKTFQDESTLSMYQSKSSLAGALAYYNAEMAARGWAERKGAAPDAKEYAMRTYNKGGYSVGMMLGSSSNDQVSITLTSLGNVDMTTLPQPPDSKRLAESSTVAAHYHTDKDVPSTADACRSALKAAGWIEYRGYEPEAKDAPKRWDSHFIKNSEHVTFLVGEIPPGGPAKTYAGYHAAQVLPVDMPVSPDATELKLDVMKWYLNYKSPQEPSRLAEFYRKAYGSLGWEDRSKKEAAPAGEGGVLLDLNDRKSSRLFVQIVPGDGKEGGSKVAIRPLAFEAKIAKAEPSSTPEYDRAVARGKAEAAKRAEEAKAKSKAFTKSMRDEVTKALGPDAAKLQKETGIDVSKMINDALKDDDDAPKAADNKEGDPKGNEPKAGDAKPETPGDAPRPVPAFIAAATMPLPQGAMKIVRDPSEKTISYDTTEDAKAQEDFFNTRLKPMGWDTVSVSRGTVNDDVHLTLGYSKDAVGLEVDIRYKGAEKTGTTVISGEGLKFDPAPGGTPAPPAAKDDMLASEDVQGLPIPKENNGHTAEGSPFRKSVEARTKVPLDKLAAFYRKSLAGRGWKESPAPAAAPADDKKLAMAFASEGGALDVTLTAGADESTIAMVQRNTEAARKAGILPRDGRSRLMIGNGSKSDAVIAINGKPYTVKAETGTKDPASAFKLDLFPGKNQVVIKIPGKADQNEVVDSAAGNSFGLMIVETGDALVLRLY